VMWPRLQCEHSPGSGCAHRERLTFAFEVGRAPCGRSCHHCGCHRARARPGLAPSEHLRGWEKVLGHSPGMALPKGNGGGLDDGSGTMT